MNVRVKPDSLEPRTPPKFTSINPAEEAMDIELMSLEARGATGRSPAPLSVASTNAKATTSSLHCHGHALSLTPGNGSIIRETS